MVYTPIVLHNSSIEDLLRFFLLPFALIYGGIMRLRNWMYDKGYLHSTRFEVPVIAVGNLSVGGTGKSPHIEYLVQMLRPHLKLSTLSRGYGRKTKGFLLANSRHKADEIGDEPRQYRLKFPEIGVAVSESRMLAIPQILQQLPGTSVILMDDAFQHRSVNPGFSILLTEYEQPYFRDNVLPFGRLREPKSAAKRADVIIVSKCPPELDAAAQESFKRELNPESYQHVYFSSLQYGTPYYIFNSQQRVQIESDMHVILLTGIARHGQMEEFVSKRAGHVYPRHYKDHHFFDRYDLELLRDSFNNIDSQRKLILTTEKDAARLELHADFLIQNKLPLFALPVRVQFLAGQGDAFARDIQHYMQVAGANYMQARDGEDDVRADS